MVKLGALCHLMVYYLGHPSLVCSSRMGISLDCCEPQQNPTQRERIFRAPAFAFASGLVVHQEQAETMTSCEGWRLIGRWGMESFQIWDPKSSYGETSCCIVVPNCQTHISCMYVLVLHIIPSRATTCPCAATCPFWLSALLYSELLFSGQLLFFPFLHFPQTVQPHVPPAEKCTAQATLIGFDI